MKKYISNKLIIYCSRYIIPCILISAAMLGTACDFTEVDLPPSQLVSETVFNDKATANAAMVSVYSGMRDAGILTGNATGISMLLGNYTDELRFYGNPQNSAASFYNNAVVQSNNDIRQLWNRTYTQVYAANAVIEGVAASEALEMADKNQLTGEALFVRALLHLYLTEIYGDVPYVRTTDYRVNSVIGKSSTAEVYNLVMQDLQLAADLLPQEYIVSDRTRPNKFAAYAILARTALYSGDWNAAAEYASAVINNNSVFVEPDAVEQTFLIGSPSTIWQFSPSTAGANTKEAATFIFESGPPPLSALTPQLVDAFEPGDLRREHWVREVTDGTQSWYHPYKYRERNNTGTSVEHSVVIRLAEMYLIRAEARIRLGELVAGSEDLNQIRNKAGLSDTAAATQQDLLQATLTERQLELFTEFAHRFIDLKRFGLLDDVLLPIKSGWDSYERLLPLPEAELNLNPSILPQNPGY